MVGQVLLLLVTASAHLILYKRVEFNAGRVIAKIAQRNLKNFLIRDDSNRSRLVEQVLARDHYLVTRLDSAENLRVLIAD